MPANNEENPIENASRGAYDGRVEVRLAVVEKRMSAVEVDVAVIRTSFATKEDVQSLRNEIHAFSERIITALNEQKLEFNIAMSKQREEFQAAFAHHREEVNAALTHHREDVNAALTHHRDEFNAALTHHREEVNLMIAKQREDFFGALFTQRDEFKDALVEQRIDLYKMHMAHMWKLYGFASLLMTGVYFIARYVH
ncbi:MICOS complex subunit MIC60 [Oxalobacteraceae bacterium OTU3REALA1]|nr:MICOS complex subunit MIC60 [Oxalobacteraceae bacterium OTU3REALA1]